jgi:excisionase family DNA binding protein
MSEALDPLVWTTSEVAQLLAVSRTTVQDMAADGRLPSIRIGRRILVPKKALAAFVEMAESQ